MKTLIEKLAKISADMRAMHKTAEDEDRGFTPEERSAWDGLLADFEDTEQRIKDAEAMERLRERANGR